jgi:hypothetical protein
MKATRQQAQRVCSGKVPVGEVMKVMEVMKVDAMYL